VIDWKHITTTIGDATETSFTLADAKSVSGGCINQAWRIQGQDGTCYFVKLNESVNLSFESERAGLDILTATNTVRVPRCITHGTADEQAFLVLEYLDMKDSGDAGLLGQQLAALHHCRAERFGFQLDNMLGETAQHNTWSNDWIIFWREQRLGYQLDLASHKGYGGKLQQYGRQLLECLPRFFDGYHPQPSLLHGDLWGGNYAYASDGAPIVFDPAPYYGDRETDLAMTELFGGFEQEFYAAYRHAWPLDEGYSVRKTLYKLYHILNHANLFGGSYARQAEGMMQHLLNNTV